MSAENTLKNWRVWDELPKYGELLKKRATGELPEMESSKAIAKKVSSLIQSHDRVLDVGCGAGHYLRSMRREINCDFEYVGADATESYIALAKEAFREDVNASFKVSDIYDLSFDNDSFDIVLCNNLLLHLPSVEKPFAELLRVTKRRLLVRTLVGSRSFRIQDVQQKPGITDFDKDGEPNNFYYYNIYSEEYLSEVISSNDKALEWEFVEDLDFSASAINQSANEHSSNNASCVIGDYQVNGYILQPWSIIDITTNLGSKEKINAET